ncbi:hypothetical protein [Aestuariibaculum sediminum]|uniref:Uncharacterized protein n=1 Tax=Aestuariibaculum sediminum TaxID=2770637 RepID=A0A8J6UFN0_9FLAO|nr:hypothetical protein [Aestuariibaculum sediminum]MBD0831481.1 hypothetical protein [Aestuariibaculum sediminum]
MKIATIIISVLALILVAFNTTKINFSAPFEGDSIVAIITILASLCAVLIMLILYISKRIEQKVKERR